MVPIHCKMKRNFISLIKASLSVTVLLLIYSTFKNFFNQVPRNLHWNSSDESILLNEQKMVNYISKYLEVKYEVISNGLMSDNNPVYQAQITLINAGEQTIPNGKWGIFFNQIHMIEPDKMKVHSKVSLSHGWFQIQHIQGQLFCLRPGEKFTGMKPGTSKEIKFYALDYSSARTDTFPNWYVASKGTVAKIMQSTEGENLQFVKPFDTPDKWKRTIMDKFDPLTPKERYEQNKQINESAEVAKILPTPYIMKSLDGNVVIDKHWVIVAPKELENEVNHLKSIFQLEWKEKYSIEGKQIKLKINQINDEKSEKKHSADCLAQAYKMSIVNHPKPSITIEGSTAAGVFYGIQSLISLTYLRLDVTEMVWKIPSVYVLDIPRFPFRSMQLDVARNFHDKKHVVKLMKVMSMYKMNRLHLHLTDDEGWRLEIPGLPELTEVGGRRGHDMKDYLEKYHILPFLGAMPQPTGLGSGYYTISFYKDMLSYAKQHHIEIVPEIDIPGHSHAAVKAMKAWRLRRLYPGSKIQDLGVSDDNDTSLYLSVQMYNDNVINPCIKSTYDFLEYITKSIVDLHKDVYPLKVFHFGGDEVPNNATQYSPACKRFFKKYPKLGDWKGHFVGKVAEIAHKHGLNLAGWEDGFYGKKGLFDRSSLPNKEVYVNPWISVWQWGRAHRAYDLANSGYKVIMSQASYLYFDHPYEPDPEERGLYWAARYTDTRKVFNFMPMHLYDNIEQSLWGDPITKEEICKPGNCVRLEKPENIVGMQGQLWSETVRNNDQLEHMIFPRLLALAERAWHHASWEGKPSSQSKKAQKQDWSAFASTLGNKELNRLEKLEIKYRLPVPGAVLKTIKPTYENKLRKEKQQLTVNTAFPGLKVQYNTDGGRDWKDLPEDYNPVTCTQLATRSHDGSRRSRSISVQNIKGALVTCQIES